MDRVVSTCQNSVFLSSCLKDWDKFGKKNFLNKCKEGSLIQSTPLILELFLKLINGEGKVDFLSKLLPEILKHTHDVHAFESKLLDILWVIDSTVSDISSEAVRDRYFRLLHICRSHVNSALLSERLSEETLENISLIHSKKQFQTRYVRTKTRLFFKQQKFNLLREENEGYAKLITEICQTAGSMESLMTHVMSLIGYFDLDPNRVLDVILDACEFRSSMSNRLVQLIRQYNPDKMDLTHILGHKFHFYQEPGSTTPESLYKVAALLVSDGLVNLDALYAHLYPTDADIQTARSRQLASAKAYRPLAPSSLSLANSSAVNMSLNSVIAGGGTGGSESSSGFGTSSGGGGALFPSSESAVNSTAASSGSSSWANPVLKTLAHEEFNPSLASEDGHLLTKSTNGDLGVSLSVDDKDMESSMDTLFDNNQKLELCAAMVRMGDWTNAQSLLDRFSGYWPTAYPALTQSICELLLYLIEPVYNRTCPLPGCMLRNRRPAKSPQSLTVDSKSRSTRQQQPGNSVVLEPVQDFAGLLRCVFPIAGYLGHNMSADVVLMVKFCRLGRAYLSSQVPGQTVVDPVYQGLFNLLDEVLLPSLSLVDANCCLAEEVWQLLRLMPYDQRYRLYGQWKHSSGSNEPLVIRRKAQVLVRAKAITRRLSKENVKPMGRQLGKLSHSNPGLLFDHVLNSIQMYTNLIGPVVEALKYVTNLGYDILAFCIIEALASDEVKLEDLQLSQGLQALSTFTGLLCKKYQFDLTGLLQYVLNQLKVGKSYDLLILREVLHRMSGIDISEEMTDEQLESMSGGELLLQEGGYYAQIRNTRKNAARLKDALVEHKFVMPFICLMAQQRDAVLFLDSPDRHVKLAGKLYDQCQGTLVQFITFLSLQLTRDEMQTQCLPIERLMGEFHVPADTAFCLHRSLFEQKVARLFEASEGSDAIKPVEKSKSTLKALFAAVSQQVCSEIAATIRPLYPTRVWDELGTSFFVTFWSLQSSDLVVPEAAYQRQIQQLRDQIQQVQDLVVTSGWTAAKKKREVDRLQVLTDKLIAEQSERHDHVARVRAWLLAERDNWFQTRLATKTDTITQFLQLCIYPRVCFTAADAIYAAQFMHVLHQLKTSRFSTLICLDRIFNDITLPTSMCTEDEAHRYGRFLCAVLELVMRWHASEEVFNQECGQYPGFVTVFRKGSDANTKADQLQFENYRHVVHKWHYRITKATVACLESGSYVQIRNALIVLTRILPQYPRIIQFGSAVERRVYKLTEEEKQRRPDLKALAFSYAGLMRPRKAKWVSEEDFHLKETKPGVRQDVPITTTSRTTGSTGSGGGAAAAETSQRVQQPNANSVSLASHEPTRRQGTGSGGAGLSTVTGNSGGSKSSGGTAASNQATGQQTQASGHTAGDQSKSAGSSGPSSSAANGPVTVTGPAASAPVKTRLSQRTEAAGGQSSLTEQAQTSQLYHPPPEEIRESKRKRLDASAGSHTTHTTSGSSPSMGSLSNKASAGSNTAATTTTTTVMDDARESRKLGRKRIIPSSGPYPDSEGGTRQSSLGVSAAAMGNSRSSEAPAQRRLPPSNSGGNTASLHSTTSTSASNNGLTGLSSRHHHHQHHSRGPSQRSSSSDSRDMSAVDDGTSAASGGNSSYLTVKKAKRTHHHHHSSSSHRRSADSSCSGVTAGGSRQSSSPATFSPPAPVVLEGSSCGGGGGNQISSSGMSCGSSGRSLLAPDFPSAPSGVSHSRHARK